jgi:hypothetical protein
MDVFRISRLATQYVVVRVKGTVLETGELVDPTNDDAWMAFMPPGGANPGSGDWKSAVWGTARAGWYSLGCLIGPDGGAITLSDLTYDVWAKFSDRPETPVIRVGKLEVY